MNALLALPVLALNLWVTIRDPRRGVFLFAGLALLLPHPSLLGYSVPYEMLGLPAILVAAAFVRRRLRHPRVHVLVATYLALVLLATVVGSTTQAAALSPIRVLGFVRALVLLGLFVETFDRRGIETLLLVVLGVNAVLGAMQLVVPGGAGLTQRLYGREGASVLEHYVEWGEIPRATGSFSTPLILGAMALFGLAMAWARMLVDEADATHRWLLLAAGIAGLVSITKTFILGAPIVLVGGLAIRAVQRARAGSLQVRSVITVGGVFVAVAGVLAAAGLYLESLGLPVGYYLSYLTEPLTAFTNRYGPGGQMEEAARVIGDNLVFGVGLTSVRGEFLGDSLYVAQLHRTGLIGALFALAVVALLARRNVAAGRTMSLLVLLALLLTGTAIDVVFKLPGAIAIAYLARLPGANAAPVGDRVGPG